jgi:hypothetical protein
VKRLNHQLEFQSGASFFAGSGDWQDKVSVSGVGEVIGAELLLKYNSSKFQSWMAYTLSRNTRQFSDLNGGRTFPYRYDRPHQFSIVGVWQPKANFNASFSWTLESGNAITLPSARYEVEALNAVPTANQFNDNLFFGPQDAYLYGARNNARMPTYHRLDFNLDFIRHKTRRSKAIKRVFSLGVYNFYSRRNPYFVFYSNTLEGRQLNSLTLFPLIPYFAYKTTFR